MSKNTNNEDLKTAQWQRWLWGIAGGVFFTLAVVDIVLPVLPTMPFLLLTARKKKKSSTKFYQWLINHPLFGKLIRDWQASGAIPLSVKIMAIGMMMISCTAFFINRSPSGVETLPFQGREETPY